MKYGILTTPEFMDYFTGGPRDFYADVDGCRLYHPLFVKFRKLINDVTFANQVYEAYQEDPQKYGSHYQEIEASLLAETGVRLDEGGPVVDYRALARALREKSPDGGWYCLDIDQLSADEVFFLISYPFWSRMGGSFEDDFARDGCLAKYLLALKEKDV